MSCPARVAWPGAGGPLRPGSLGLSSTPSCTLRRTTCCSTATAGRYLSERNLHASRQAHIAQCHEFQSKPSSTCSAALLPAGLHSWVSGSSGCADNCAQAENKQQRHCCFKPVGGDKELRFHIQSRARRKGRPLQGDFRGQAKRVQAHPPTERLYLLQACWMTSGVRQGDYANV